MTGSKAPYDLAEEDDIIGENEMQEQLQISREPSSAVRISQEQITEVDEGGTLSHQQSEGYQYAPNLLASKKHATRSSPLRIHLQLAEKEDIQSDK